MHGLSRFIPVRQGYIHISVQGRCLESFCTERFGAEGSQGAITYNLALFNNTAASYYVPSERVPTTYNGNGMQLDALLFFFEFERDLTLATFDEKFYFHPYAISMYVIVKFRISIFFAFPLQLLHRLIFATLTDVEHYKTWRESRNGGLGKRNVKVESGNREEDV